MNIFINGQATEVAPASTLLQALEQHLADKGDYSFAVAVNSEFIGKEQYQSLQMSANDSIDIMMPIVGG